MRRLALSGFLALAGVGVAFAEGEVGFRKAQPVWPKGEEATLNFSCRFRGEFRADGTSACVLRVTSAYAYRVKLNGQFAGFGPARAAHRVIQRCNPNTGFDAL